MKPLRVIEVQVTGVQRETADTFTIQLTPTQAGADLDREAGQFLVLDPHTVPGLEQKTDAYERQTSAKAKLRAYSVMTPPGQPVAITVKRVRHDPKAGGPPPLVSAFMAADDDAVRIPIGARFKIRGFTGQYFLPKDVEARADRIVHVAAGSGIVPNFAIIAYALERYPNIEHVLIDSNRSWDDIIYRKQLEDLQRRFPGRLKVLYTLSREENASVHGANVRSGHVDRQILTEAIADPSRTMVFSCGPAEFVKTASDVSKSLGVPADNVFQEAY
jgi:3-ketosteroid 9alpha-monooxygenase subunit B